MDYHLYLNLLDGSRGFANLRNVDRLYVVGQTFNDATATPKRWEVTEILETIPPTMIWTEIARNRSS